MLWELAKACVTRRGLWESHKDHATRGVLPGRLAAEMRADDGGGTNHHGWGSSSPCSLLPLVHPQDAWLWECALGVVADLRQGAFEAVLAQDMGFLESASAVRGRSSKTRIPRHGGEGGQAGPGAGAREAGSGEQPQEAARKIQTLGAEALGSEALGGDALGSEAAPEEQEAEVGSESMALGDVLFRLTIETRECGDVVFALLKVWAPLSILDPTSPAPHPHSCLPSSAPRASTHPQSTTYSGASALRLISLVLSREGAPS